MSMSLLDVSPMHSCRTTSHSLGVVALLCLCGNAQGSEINENVDEFNEISMSVNGTVDLIQSDEHRISLRLVRGKLDDLEIDVEHGTLQISRDCGFMNRCVRPYPKIEGTIYFKSIDTLKMHGGGRMTVTDLTSPKLDVAINGSGSVEIGSIDSEDVDFTINGSGDVSVERGEFDQFLTKINGAGNIAVEEGTTTSCTVEVNGSGDFSGIGLKSVKTDVNVIGAGDVRVHATDELNVTIIGAGDVTYDGTPEVSRRILGAGNISKL